MPKTTASTPPKAGRPRKARGANLSPVGARLRAARQASGRTLQSIADAMGITNSVIMDIEVGRRNPSLDWLLRAAEAMGCDPSELDPRLASREELAARAKATPAR